ncbi:MAG TPA: anaerobic ribonucleoside-triphosphate reductase activating protein, partial [Candidatus Cloacimonadota bacterium]|nr:anaerobic ribonucleoside-triphosphate reductase activating protein [Candidatus Cloacimonadota bacterium]
FSMIDYPNRISAIIFTQGCNFRCPYCHNPELVDPSRMKSPLDNEKILSFLRTRKTKLDAVCITGGEPTLQPDLVDFCREIKEMGYLVKLDTNGSQPHILEELCVYKLIDFVAMDIKAPLDRYEWVTQVPVPEGVIMKSIEILRKFRKEREFRTTVVHPLLGLADIEKIVALFIRGETYCLQKYAGKQTLDSNPKQYQPFSTMLMHAVSQKAVPQGVNLILR